MKKLFGLVATLVGLFLFAGGLGAFDHDGSPIAAVLGFILAFGGIAVLKGG